MEVQINSFTFSISHLLLIVFIIYSLVLTLKVLPRYKLIREPKRSKIEDWLDKKDLTYWIIILCLGAISVFTYEYSGDKDAISHWGFAGTIVSIILAVIAIIFTFYQSFTNEISANKIEKAADIITEATRELDASELKSSSEIIYNLAENMKVLNTTLEKKIDEITSEITDIKDEQRTHQDYIKSYFQLNYGGNGQNTHSNTFSKDVIETIVRSLPFYSILIIYAVNRFNESGVVVNKEVINNFSSGLTDYQISYQLDNPSDFERGLYNGANFIIEVMTINLIESFGINIQTNTSILDHEAYQIIIDIIIQIYNKQPSKFSEYEGIINDVIKHFSNNEK